MHERIAPYILAGGRSTRMGRDKAMLTLAGKTLLGRAVETLRAVPALCHQGERGGITVLGDRALLEGANRAIRDEHTGCGPLGGIEAALADLEQSSYADWALFLPVDMPFLPAGLLDALLRHWMEAICRGVLVCHVSIDETPQPLVSLVHRRLYPHIHAAIVGGRFKVTHVLQSATAALARTPAEQLTCEGQTMCQTSFNADLASAIDASWSPTGMQQRTRHLWFANLNTQEDFLRAETFIFNEGWTA